jgi:hypothetical protein
MATPAFAAGNVVNTDGFIFVGTQTLYEENFTYDGTYYSCNFYPDGFKANQDGDTCVVTIGSETFTSHFLGYRGSADDLTKLGYLVGNPALLGEGHEDNGEPFVFLLNSTDKNKCLFVCTSEIYAEQVSGTGSVGISIVLSAPVRYVPTIMEQVTSVFNSGIGMVGSVAGVVVGNPILFLPIVIGLCGIGVAFFNRLKQ